MGLREDGASPIAEKETDANVHDTPLKLDVPTLIADPLTDVLRQDARQPLAQAVRAEVEAFLAQHAHLKDDQGRARPWRSWAVSFDFSAG